MLKKSAFYLHPIVIVKLYSAHPLDYVGLFEKQFLCHYNC
jgi:hypothetical protein